MEATASLPQHSSVYQIVTEQIIKQLESGVAPWSKPWTTSAPKNLITQREYSGFNVIMLASQGYASPYWLTFNQCSKLGGRIKRGERSSLVTFWQFGEYTKHDAETGEDERCKSALLRYYRVFNQARLVEHSALTLHRNLRADRCRDAESAQARTV